MQRTKPGPGQESVWEYPRPPRIEKSSELIRVVFGGREVGRTENSLRVLETSHPPVYYLPIDDIDGSILMPSTTTSFCEFKGSAGYYSLVVGDVRSADAAWTYLDPAAGYESLAGHVAFYPGRVDACYVGNELVLAQAGGFYGGWITSRVVGPFKGGPGTLGW